MGMKENDFSALLRGLSLCATANVDRAQTGGSAVARYRGAAGDEYIQAVSAQHILTMCAARPARFEGRNGHGRSLVYAKQPGALCLVPAGICPPLRSLTEFELVVCALDIPFVEKVDAEIEYRSAGDFRLQTNIHDRAARQLMRLLIAAANEDIARERLYIDHLAHALAFRFLVLAKASALRPAAPAPAALPRHAMRRVEERMRGLENDLSLEALARESGYSPIHFSRMFRAATGHTPHNYVLHLRVQRARQLLAEPSASLTEIALECGFSSHSHMTRVFHQLVGMTPSAYRRTR
jgi:AraC family transcriptional regulator